jgi:hypothetical protein
LRVGADRDSLPEWLEAGAELPSFKEVEVDVNCSEVEQDFELTALPEAPKRFLTAKQAHTVLRSISIGYFCRLLQMNVDSKGRMHPLVDAGPDHDFDPLNFCTYFVDNGSGPPYNANTKVQLQDFLPWLEETVQRHVFPHPIRTHDVVTLCLITCTCGGHRRLTRKGFVWLETNTTSAADFLINSIVLQILGMLHPLKLWCVHLRSRLGCIGTWFLPGVREVDAFLGFVKKAVLKAGTNKKRKNECCQFTSEQLLCTLDEQFKTLRGFEQVLTNWKQEAKPLLEGFVVDAKDGQVSNTRELFMRRMLNVFIWGGCRNL